MLFLLMLIICCKNNINSFVHKQYNNKCTLCTAESSLLIILLVSYNMFLYGTNEIYLYKFVY